MIQRIDHLGIAVRNLDEAIPRFEKLLGRACEHVEVVEQQKVRTAFFQLGEVSLELLEPTDASSAVARFLETRGEGIHHVALATDAVAPELDRVSREGVRRIDENPVAGAHGKQVAFLHPKSTGGILFELCSAAAERVDEP